MGLQRGEQAFQHQGGLSRTGHPGDGDEPALGQVQLQRADRMERPGTQADAALLEHLPLPRLPAEGRGLFPGQKRPDEGVGVFRRLGHRPLGQHPAPVGPRTRPHLDEPVGSLQHPGIVVHQHHRIAPRHQIPDQTQKPVHIGRVQADGWLVQYVQYPCGPVPYRPGQLDPLPLPGGQGGSRPVQGQVAQPQLQKPPGRGLKGLADALGHGAHLLRQSAGDPVHPLGKLLQGHPAGLVQPNAPELGRPGRRGEPGPAAVRAEVPAEEFLHPLHPALVLHFGEGVLHGIDRVIVGKVQLGKVVGIGLFLGVVENMLLLRRPVKDDVPLLLGQFPKGHIGTHPHRPAHVGHQGPHEAIPRGHRPLVDGEGLVGHQGALIHPLHHPDAPAGPAGPLAVEGQLLRAGGKKLSSTLRADQLPPRRHRHGGGMVMSIGAAVAGKAGIHEPQAVQKLRHGTEGAADPRQPGPLVEGQGCRDVLDAVQLGLGGLGHPPSGIGGQGLQVPPGALGIEDPQGQRRLSGP